MVAEEMSKIKGDIDELLELKKKIEAGGIMMLPTEQMDLPEFSPADMEQCKCLVLDELAKNGEMFPTDIAEKHDLDPRMVIKCVIELKKEGRIEEVPYG